MATKAPPLFVTEKLYTKSPPVRRINPAAVAYLQQAAASGQKSPLSAAYSAADVSALRQMAPPLVTQTDKGDQGLEAINPAAVAFAMSSGLPFTWVYPDPPALVRWAHSPQPGASPSWGFGSIPVHGWQEINPAAIDYVKRAGKKFIDVYPHGPPWSSHIDGSKDTALHYCALVGKPFEGPGAIYKNVYHPGSGFADFVSNVVSTCGRAIGSGIGAVDNAVGSIGTALDKIPFVGAPLAAIYDNAVMTPFRVADELAHGESIDKVVIGEFKDKLADMREIAPYAQVVIAVVPGIGPIASGAISASFAIAEGEPIQDVLIAAAAGAVPGGAIAAAAFRVGESVLAGKGDPITAVVDLVQAAGVPVPDTAKQIIEAGLHAAVSIARGEKPDQAIVDAAIAVIPDPTVKAAAEAAQAAAQGKNVADVLLQYGPSLANGLPDDVKQQVTDAIGTGMAMGNAETLQRIEQTQIAQNIGKLATDGAANVDAVMKATRAALPAAAQYGFDVGAGFVKRQVTRFQEEATRKLLNAAQQVGYDAALALHVGRVTQAPPKGASPAVIAGHAISHGIVGAPRAVKKPLLKAIDTNPQIAEGMAQSAKVITKAQRVARWKKIKRVAGTAAGLLGGTLVAGPAGLALPVVALAGGTFGGVADVGEWWRKRKPVSNGAAA